MTAFRRLWTLLCIGLLLGGCGSPAATVTPTLTVTSAPSIQAVLAASTLVLGPNRLPLGIVVDGTPINDPATTVHLRFFYLDGEESPEPTLAGETDAVYFGRNLPFGVYVAYPDFPKAGGWGIEVITTRPSQPPVANRLRVDVLATDPTPAIGSAARSVETPTLATTPAGQPISSAPTINPRLYELSVADALAQNRPFAVLFATPGFCKTAVCGPNIDVVGQLQEQFGDHMAFIHVEVYQFPFGESAQATPPRFSAGMTAWQLQSEPWLFVVDSTGTIRAKYEGGITTDELTPLIETFLATTP